jgi:hypothetical protein
VAQSWADTWCRSIGSLVCYVLKVLARPGVEPVTSRERTDYTVGLTGGPLGVACYTNGANLI